MVISVDLTFSTTEHMNKDIKFECFKLYYHSRSCKSNPIFILMEDKLLHNRAYELKHSWHSIWINLSVEEGDNKN